MHSSLENNRPLTVTIVTPCRNSVHLIPETLESILNQSSLKNGSVQLQHLIIDGASSDATAAVVEPYLKYGVQFFSEPDRGMYDALAKGLQKATGDIVGYLNAGDILFPHAFEILEEVFQHPDVEWVTGYSTIINDRLQITNAGQPPRYRRQFIENGYYIDPSYPQNIQQESTFWSQKMNSLIDFKKLRSFTLAGDYFLWTELAKQTELHSIRSLLGAFRVHAGQLSENSSAYYQEAKSLVRKATFREKLTRYWETRCNPLLRSPLWNHTLGIGPAKIFEYRHPEKKWMAR
ncbi:MAG: glycosyltransferase [Chthoniobacterales bacterium]